MENSNETNGLKGFEGLFGGNQTGGEEKANTGSETRKSETLEPSYASTQAHPQIPDDSAPFIVLCGPPASGKSMVLKSLASYLYDAGQGYTISANTTLLNTVKYQNDCKDFDSIIGQSNTRMQNTVDYLMADIVDGRGNVAAHFLEAPGEDFFSLNNPSEEPNIPFKSYLDKIAQTTSGKQRQVIYIILLDLDSATSLRNDKDLRQKYEAKMVKLYNRYVVHHPSRIILLYNKVDLPQQGLWANTHGCSNPSAIIADAKRYYSKLFFTRKFLFWDVENYTFLPYCTGSYDDGDGYTASGPVYPSSLWKEIKKLW